MSAYPEINSVHLTGQLEIRRLLRDGRRRPFMAIGVLGQGEARYPVVLTKGALKHCLKTRIDGKRVRAEVFGRLLETKQHGILVHVQHVKIVGVQE